MTSTTLSVFAEQDYQNLITELHNLSDEKYKIFIQKLIPGREDQIIGVRTPELVKVAKKLLKTYDAASMIDFFYDSQYYTGSLEERGILGTIICSMPFAAAENLFAAIDRYIPYIDNWATCDSFSGKLSPFFPQWKNEFWCQVQDYLKSSNPWKIRLGLVIIIAYFCESAYIDRIFECIRPIESDHYYLRMGIAWMISMLYLEDKPKVLKLMQDNIADDWVFNKSIQKIRESRQIDNDEKQYLNTFKRM